MKMASILSVLMTIIASTNGLGILAMEEKEKSRVFNAISRYISNSDLSPKELLHTIQSKDFNSEGYSFHYSHQGSYLQSINLCPDYPRYEPIGMPQIESFSPMISPQSINLKWLIKDNPSSGFDTFFSMQFNYDIIFDQLEPDVKLSRNVTANKDVTIVPERQEQQFKVGTISINPSQIFRIRNFIAKAGYDGLNFNFNKFSQWYCRKFMGYRGEKIGFNSSRKPIVFSSYYGENLCSYLDILKGYYVHLPFSKGICDQIESDAENLLKEILSILPKASVRAEAEVRKMLTIKGDLVYNQSDEISTLNNSEYAVDTQGNIYVRGENFCHHPELLKGMYGLCLGHISIKDGRIYFISNNSGHYKPHVYHLYSYIESLNKEVFTPDCVVEFYVQTQVEKRVSIEMFLSLNKDELSAQWEKEVKERIDNDTFFKKVVSQFAL